MYVAIAIYVAGVVINLLVLWLIWDGFRDEVTNEVRPAVAMGLILSAFLSVGEWVMLGVVAMVTAPKFKRMAEEQKQKNGNETI